MGPSQAHEDIWPTPAMRTSRLRPKCRSPTAKLCQYFFSIRRGIGTTSHDVPKSNAFLVHTFHCALSTAAKPPCCAYMLHLAEPFHFALIFFLSPGLGCGLCLGKTDTTGGVGVPGHRGRSGDWRLKKATAPKKGGYKRIGGWLGMKRRGFGQNEPSVPKGWGGVGGGTGTPFLRR